MLRTIRLIGFAAVIWTIADPAAVGADSLRPAGPVIVAKASGDALLIWDASTEVASIVSNKIPDADANALLEHQAARVLEASLGKIDKSATTVTVRVIYNKTGEVSPIYGSATFAGVERYATLEMSAKDATADRAKWQELDEKSAFPNWVVFKVTGQLPQR